MRPDPEHPDCACHECGGTGQVLDWHDGRPLGSTKPCPRCTTVASGDPESCPKCGAAWNGLECYECDYQEGS